MKKVALFIPIIYKHESLDELAARLKLAIGDLDIADSQVAQRIDELPVGSVVVIDSFHRLGENADRVAIAISKILDHSGCEILIPNMLELRRSNPEFDSLVHLIALFANVKRSVKSSRIRESLFIKAQLNGGAIHDSGITPELKKLVIEEFQRCRVVRQTSRRLKEIGFNISPSSVSRILKEAKSHE